MKISSIFPYPLQKLLISFIIPLQILKLLNFIYNPQHPLIFPPLILLKTHYFNNLSSPPSFIDLPIFSHINPN